MTAAALAFLFVLSGTSALSQSPFDRYLDDMQRHRIDGHESAFLSKCGIEPSSIKPAYGVGNNGSWTKTNDLGEAMSHLETDFFNTAEIWWQNGQARVVNFWSLELDVGSASNTLYCFSQSGKIQFAESTTSYTPVDGGTGEWTCRQQIHFNNKEQLDGRSVSFIDGRGRPVAAPKLDDEDKKNFDWVPDLKTVRETISKLPPN